MGRQKEKLGAVQKQTIVFHAQGLACAPWGCVWHGVLHPLPPNAVQLDLPAAATSTLLHSPKSTAAQTIKLSQQKHSCPPGTAQTICRCRFARTTSKLYRSVTQTGDHTGHEHKPAAARGAHHCVQLQTPSLHALHPPLSPSRTPAHWLRRSCVTTQVSPYSCSICESHVSHFSTM